jgi:hypothetical protein
LKPWRKKQWCIPPQANAAFVCNMEDVLEVYKRPYDPHRPVVCLDETSRQLLGDTRPPLPCAPGQPVRPDHEYQRGGTANLFLAFEPLAGQRHTQVSEQRTKVDWARFVKELLDGRYATAEKVVLVQDNLNTHTPASLYEAFEPAEARRLVEKLELHYTPKHGSWLNLAEVEFSVLERQLPPRTGSRGQFQELVSAWTNRRNHAQVCADWRFTTADARIKLKRLYPCIGV